MQNEKKFMMRGRKELLTEFDEIVEELFFLSVKEKELVERMDNLAEGKVDQ